MPLFLPPRALLPSLAAGLLSSCSLTVKQPYRPAETPVLAGKSAAPGALREARAVLAKLDAERTAFMRSGDAAKIFSVYYRHVTSAILDKAAEGSLVEPGAILGMVCDFYAVYRQNQDPRHRSAHWQPYYDLVNGSGRPDFKTGRAVIQRGVTAHIDYDLPPIIIRALQRHQELQANGAARLKRAMDDLSSLFLPCSRLGMEDLARVLPGAPGPQSLAFQSRVGYAIILHKRERAWREAMRALATMEPSPATSSRRPL